MLYGAAYYPEHRDPARWEYDLERMADASVNALRVGEFAWDRFEPAPDGYDFEWFDRWFALAQARGIGIVLCPPMRTPPAWLAHRLPDLPIQRNDGVRLAFGTRYSFCITHPELLDRAAMLAERLARRYGPSPAVRGWHLDNEHGDEPDCHCPRCRGLFSEFCRERYGDDLERLNTAWGLDFWSLRFNAWEQIPTPAVSKAFHAPGHWLAWRRFRSAMTIRAALRQRDALLPHRSPAQFVTTNFQVQHNPRTDYYAFARHLDVCGTNYYPRYGRLERESIGLANARGYREGQNFHVFELRNGAHLVPGLAGNTPAPGEVARLAGLCVAHGAEGLFHFRWRACPFGCEQSHGAVTDYDGEPLAIYPEVARVGRWLARNGARIDVTRVESPAAVLYDFPTRWATEYASQWNGPTGLYADEARAAYDALRAAGIGTDTIGRDADWTRYRLLAVPGLAAVDASLAARIARYVRDGGTLVAWPQTAHRDEESRYFAGRLPPALAEVFGVRLGDVWTDGEAARLPVRWTGASGGHADAGCARLFGERPVLRGATALAEYADGPWQGAAAVTAHDHGEGAAYLMMTYPDAALLSGVLANAAARAGLAGGKGENGVELVTRLGAKERWLFVFNHGGAPARADLPPDGLDTWNDDEPVGGLTEIPPGAGRAGLSRAPPLSAKP